MPLKYYLFAILLFPKGIVAQVGIGTEQPHSSTQLHIVSEDRGVLFPQVPLKSNTDQETISNGNVVSLLVYNTSNTTDLNPGYHYWNGTQWSPLGVESVYTGNGAPTPSAPNAPGAGSIYVDESTGDLYTFNGSDWIKQSITATNGLSIDNQQVKLGGELTAPTTIKTSPNNTLSIEGLENDDSPKVMLVVDPESGALKTSKVSSLFREEVVLHIATDGQTQFQTPETISDPKKVNVYRNGVRIDFTPIDDTTIALEQGVACYANDEIRIVQFN